jgi:polyferredoxin
MYPLQHYLAAGWESLRFLVMVTILFAIMGVILGRLFCGWVCPLGFIQDLLIHIRKFLLMGYSKLPSALNDFLTYRLRYVVLILLVFTLWISSMPFVSAGWRRALDLPLCQVCPSKPLWLLLQGGLKIIPPAAALDFSKLSLVMLCIFIAGAFLIRRFWCRFCPMGGLISLLKGVSLVSISKEAQKCTKCGTCTRSCPVGVTEVYEGDKGGDITSSRCVRCFRCIQICPEERCLQAKLLGLPIYNSKAWWQRA